MAVFVGVSLGFLVGFRRSFPDANLDLDLDFFPSDADAAARRSLRRLATTILKDLPIVSASPEA